MTSLFAALYALVVFAGCCNGNSSATVAVFNRAEDCASAAQEIRDMGLNYRTICIWTDRAP